MTEPLSKNDINKISKQFPEGIPSTEIVKIFQDRGFKFSEATFRKYVQMGLVERCRRVGRKGKHRGSQGLYPVSTIERINSIKRMISGDITLEQLRGSYFSIRQRVEEAERIFVEVQTEVMQQAEKKERKDRHDVQIRKELENLQKLTTKLVQRLEQLETAQMAL